MTDQCRCALGAHEDYRCEREADDADGLCEICRWYAKEIEQCE